MNTPIPAFANDFQWAVIRLATLQTQRNQAGQLLFCTVTLLSQDRQPPPKMNGVDRQKVGKTGKNIFFRRTILTANDAIQWYRSLNGENAKTPIPSRSEDIERDKNDNPIDGREIKASDLIDDPAWPNLGLPFSENLFSDAVEKSHPAPFMGNDNIKTHRRFGSIENFEDIISDQESIDFIGHRLHINLKEYPEYLGSVVLITPDPIIRRIENFLIPATQEHGERILFRLIPRPDKTLDDLKITTFDIQADLLVSFETRSIPPDGILDIEKGSCIGVYGYVITHPIHGILSYHPPTGFLRQMSSSIGLVTQTRKINVPTSEALKSPRNEYTVQRTHYEKERVIGSAAPKNVNLRVGLAGRQREKVNNAKRFDQYWFDGNSREEAMSFIRSKISRARNQIIIADPYFGMLQIPQFLLAVTSGTVQIKILTSRLAFETEFSPESNDSNIQTNDRKITTLISKLELFSEELERVKKMGNPNIEAMVLLGKSPILHDRFLVVDDNIWFMGNSLNTLGERASMIIKLPNPDNILYALNKMTLEAKSFYQYQQNILDRKNTITPKKHKILDKLLSFLKKLRYKN